MNRREALLVLGGIWTGFGFREAAAATRRSRLGVVSYALGIHQRQSWAGRHQGVAPALAFLEECHALGAGGIQVALGPTDAPHIVELRKHAEKYGMHVQAIINPPADHDEVARFEDDVRTAKEAGANVARTVLMPGRRYEQFKSMEALRESEKRALASLQLAEPVLARQRFRLAIENHKDQLIAEKLGTLKLVGSEWIGLCVDVGNNFALMEDPYETVRAFAPFAFTVHLKDMVAQEYADGWLQADVALGDGFLDLQRIVHLLRAGKPDLKFYLETITRDAIKIPVRTDAYWVTLPGDRTAAMERAWAVVKARPGLKFPAGVSALPVKQQLKLERRNVQRSLDFAWEKLGL